MEPLKIDSSLDAISALLALGEVIDGKRNLIIESSGSTGTPKEIELSGRALVASANATATRLGGHGQWLLALKPNYIAGAQVLVRSLVADTQPVIMNTAVPFSAEGFTRSVNFMTHEKKFTSLVPVQIDVISRDESAIEALTKFTAVLVGGQQPNTKTFNLLRERGVNLITTYGMAETSGGVVYDGVPLDGVAISINDDGRIVIDSPTLAESVSRPFVTNDIGEIIEGKLIFKGRANRVINSGGVKLSLEEVEAWTHDQRFVIEAVAVRTAHEKFGESFVCFVEQTVEDEIDFSRAPLSLGIAAKAGIWKRIEKLPRLENGKPDLQFLELMANQFGAELG